MKVKCIDNLEGDLFLTEGGEYEVIDMIVKEGEVIGCRVKNNFGLERLYSMDYFEVIEDEVKIDNCTKSNCPNYDIEETNCCDRMIDVSLCDKLNKTKEKSSTLQCNTCIHSIVCGHKKQWEDYCKEHIKLREKCILFDEEPNCKYYLVNEAIKDAKEETKTELSFVELIKLLDKVLGEK